MGCYPGSYACHLQGIIQESCLPSVSIDNACFITAKTSIVPISVHRRSGAVFETVNNENWFICIQNGCNGLSKIRLYNFTVVDHWQYLEQLKVKIRVKVTDIKCASERIFIFLWLQ